MPSLSLLQVPQPTKRTAEKRSQVSRTASRTAVRPAASPMALDSQHTLTVELAQTVSVAT